ncbi:MAG: hemerythrin domain-containing protein [Muribaculaceae bacterium]|nr:hemerythrin domain-containing protein [Muribaculaceae bacterium]
MKKKNTLQYHYKLKMADVIFYDPTILGVLDRLDIKLGFGEATIRDICVANKLSENLFLMICNIYSFDGYIPDTDMLASEDALNIISYLRRSHSYYTNVLFGRIHKNIHKLLENCDEVNSRILNKFYDDYDNDVKKHFEYEENTVFPYIFNLIRSNKKEVEYNIEQFEQNHSDIDEKLNDLKNIIIKYLPSDCCAEDLRLRILYDIFFVERDLIKHTLIENKILSPLVYRLERHEQ